MNNIDKLILGTVQFGLKYGINNNSQKPNQYEVNEILLHAHQSGIRSLDTAEAYGDAHEVIGRFHRDYPSNIFNIITKLPADIEGVEQGKIEKYLCELNVGKLKGIMFHSYDTYKKNAPIISMLNSYKAEGKVDSVGVSIYTNKEMEDVISDDRIDLIQLPFNLFDNANLRGEIINKAKDKGKTIHTRSVFLQGLFFTSLLKDNPIIKALIEELKYIHKFSEQINISLQKLALNYCLQQKGIDQVLIGVDNLKQLKQNLIDANYGLSVEHMDSINKILIKNINLLNPSLWN